MVKADSRPPAETDQEIESLDRQIRERQDIIERQDVVARLNEGRVNPTEREYFYQLLNDQAQARSQHVELRLKRLRAKLNLGG